MIKKVIFTFSCFALFLNLHPHIIQAPVELILMVENNDVNALANELRAGVNPNVGFEDLSLLMIAAQLGNIEVACELLAHELTDMHLQDDQGNTALHYAAIYDQYEILKLLLYVDTPVDCTCKKRSHRRYLYQIRNKDGKVAADFARCDDVYDALQNPDKYIKEHAQEFCLIDQWFQEVCPKRARERALRQENWVKRNYLKTKYAFEAAKDKTTSAAHHAYEKTKDAALNGYEKTKKVKRKVDKKCDKATDFVVRRYQKVKDVASHAYDKTKEVCSHSYEQGKDVATKSYVKTKNAVKKAYQKVKDKLTS